MNDLKKKNCLNCGKYEGNNLNAKNHCPNTGKGETACNRSNALQAWVPIRDIRKGKNSGVIVEITSKGVGGEPLEGIVINSNNCELWGVGYTSKTWVPHLMTKLNYDEYAQYINNEEHAKEDTKEMKLKYESTSKLSLDVVKGHSPCRDQYNEVVKAFAPMFGYYDNITWDAWVEKVCTERGWITWLLDKGLIKEVKDIPEYFEVKTPVSEVGNVLFNDNKNNLRVTDGGLLEVGASVICFTDMRNNYVWVKCKRSDLKCGDTAYGTHADDKAFSAKYRVCKIIDSTYDYYVYRDTDIKMSDLSYDVWYKLTHKSYLGIK